MAGAIGTGRPGAPELTGVASHGSVSVNSECERWARMLLGGVLLQLNPFVCSPNADGQIAQHPSRAWGGFPPFP